MDEEKEMDIFWTEFNDIQKKPVKGKLSGKNIALFSMNKELPELLKMNHFYRLQKWDQSYKIQTKDKNPVKSDCT